MQTQRNRLSTGVGAVLLVLISRNVFAITPVLDGDDGEWTQLERLDGASYHAVAGFETYGTFDTTHFHFALRSPSPIGAGTTFWLNSDQDDSTGYQIFGLVGGAEFNINFFLDGTPYLYTDADGQTYVMGPLPHAYDASGTFVEFSLPVGWMQLGEPRTIDILLDVNNATFIPSDYSREAMTIYGVLPPRTRPEKRIGIIYSATNEANFFQPKAYSQLCMAVQHQSMQAGLPFDLLAEEALTDVANIVNYDALVMPFFACVPQSSVAAIETTLQLAVERYGIGLVVADDFLTNDENGAPLAGDPYSRMKRILGLQRLGGYGPAPIEFRATTSNHSILDGYLPGEVLMDIASGYTNQFGPFVGANTESLFEQESFGTVSDAVIAVNATARSVHFATPSYLADTNLVWPALRWAVFGDNNTYGLKLGRQSSVFVSRNDMDQSQFVADVPLVYPPLLAIVESWKSQFNFVGSYFINVGNEPEEGAYTDWSLSGPFLQSFLDLGNEVGTHSHTHPHDTNALSLTEIEFEFLQSKVEIEQNLSIQISGGAIPGAPDTLETALAVSQYLDYVTGGYSGIGAGYPGAFGYLKPGETTVYLSPNMTFDFSNIEFLGRTAAETEAVWSVEYADILSHANQPIVHWPWHDYAPTVSLVDGYTVEMFTNTISMAHSNNAEFITSDDLFRRIQSLQAAQLAIEGNTLTVTGGDTLGRMALEARGPGVIRNVGDWYAYNDSHILLPRQGGQFQLQFGPATDEVVHILELPMRGELISVVGDGQNLDFSFYGAGTVRIYKPSNLALAATGMNSARAVGNIIELVFDDVAEHDVQVFPATTTALADANFDSSAEGFAYADDTFRNSNQPAHASGSRISNGGFSGGALNVLLGGLDNNDIFNMSGSWDFPFSLPSTMQVSVSFRYNLTQAANYESDELTQVLLAVDGALVGSGTNDYLAQIRGNGNGGGSQSTGWQEAAFQLGAFSAGNHVISIGGFSNKKTFADEQSDLRFDNVLITVSDAIANNVLAEADFDGGTDGFTYQDDLFRSTQQPNYASGSRVATGGFSGGALRVLLGGLNNAFITHMSGGWRLPITLPSPQSVTVTLRYRLTQNPNYESDEFAHMLLAVDGTLHGLGGNDYIARIQGNGNGGAAISTDWQTVTIELGTLGAGTHHVEIGGYSNKKTFADEQTEVLIDDVTVSTNP